MKLTQKLKEHIDRWFSSKSPEDLVRLGEKYGMEEDRGCPCEGGGSGWCHKHHVDTL